MEGTDDKLFDDLEPETGTPRTARVLLAMPEGPERRRWAELLRKAGHVSSAVDGLEQAHRALSTDTVDVAVIDVRFADGSGMRLARHIHRCNLRAKMMMVAESGSFDLAAEAMRLGAVDALSIKADEEPLLYAVACAAMKAREQLRSDQRVARLRDMCRKLNAAKIEASRQVQVLCNDLASAYEDIADQLSDASMASEFRTLLSQELDLEALLRTTLEYMLTKTGPTNAAVFLPDPQGNYSLGAYVNYNCPRETADVLLDHLCSVVCPHMAQEQEIVRFDDADELAQWLGSEASFLAGSQVVAFNCRDGEHCHAVMVLFRDATEPFGETLAAVLETLRPIFARQIASIIRVHRRAKPEWPREAEDAWDTDEDYGLAA